MIITHCNIPTTSQSQTLGIRLIDSEGMMFESFAQAAAYHGVATSVVNSCSSISKPQFMSKTLNKKVAVISCISEYEYEHQTLYRIHEELLKKVSAGIHCYIIRKEDGNLYDWYGGVYGKTDNNDESDKYEIKDAIRCPKNHILYRGGSRWIRQPQDDSYGWDLNTMQPIKFENAMFN